jgi:pilus assembly protein CpaC
MSIDERVLALTPATLGKTFNFGDRVDLAGTIINEGDFLMDMFIEAAQQQGLARVLAKPTLLARSGQAASFLAGGEVPIPIAQGGAFGSITIEFKEFGVGVQFAPTVLGPDRIYLEVSPEVSQPDFTLATISGGALIPGFITRKASTSVELGDGQSFAIAGLLSDQVNSAVEKYPLFGDIPVLGALFRSVSFQRNDTELVMIVTPRIVKPLPAGQIHLPTDAYVAPNDFELYLLGALESQREGSPQSSADAGSAGLIGPAGHRLPVSMEEENAQ